MDLVRLYLGCHNPERNHSNLVHKYMEFPQSILTIGGEICSAVRQLQTCLPLRLTNLGHKPNRCKKAFYPRIQIFYEPDLDKSIKYVRRFWRNLQLCIASNHYISKQTNTTCKLMVPIFILFSNFLVHIK